MIYSIKKDEIKDLEELEDLQLKVKKVRLVEKISKQVINMIQKNYLNQSQKLSQIASKKYLRRLNSIQKQLRIWMNQIIKLNLRIK